MIPWRVVLQFVAYGLLWHGLGWWAALAALCLVESVVEHRKFL